MNVALAHHWLTQLRGGEKVLQQLAALFPGSPILTLVHDRALQIPELAGRSIVCSPLNRLPRATRWYRQLLPMHPWAIRRIRVPDHVELLVSSDAALIKGLVCPRGTTHVCYCHSPPRYLWELGRQYKQASLAARLALDRFAPALREFDFAAAQRVTHFIANSHFVAERIRRYYGRDAEVVYPPVAVHEFSPSRQRQPFALVISELVPYKRIEIAVQAFNWLRRRLVVIGDGPERKRLQSLAGPTIEFLGRQPLTILRQHYETAALFIFPGIEDFGITPLEAQAAGCPVIALRAGGALETVLEGRTGAFFDAQDPDALAAAVEGFDSASIDPSVCRQNAERFAPPLFRQRFVSALARCGIAATDHVAAPEPVTAA
jgi:glycosyltransferase involved in cell wall biosynthesis